ncbi:MAG: 3-phosphoserine/phosphohydroxythreonine transaminase [Deltaproteobacteria bacterium]|nr:3-phosphoserine/phosphohydroxythreonine transaminase [Deltaproteobacteria bacterium]
MKNRIFNFSAGPCTLPLSALEKAQKDFVDYQGAGMSIIEMSHRGKHYDKVHFEAIANIRELLSVPEDFDIMFIQGGATLQFAMVPMNFLGAGKVGEYVNTGAWAKKAIADGKKIGETKVIWSGEDKNFTVMPKPLDIKFSADAAFVHMCSNETIGGIECHDFPDTGSVPLIADMSSHIMSRPIDFSKIDMAYGGVQKNLGPAGMAVVIMKKSLVEKANENLPAYLSYKIHASKDSLYNTPSVFVIYIMKLTTDWVKEIGGLKAVENLAISRSGLVYEAIDNSGGWYSCPVDKNSRSRMNVVWRLPSEDLEKKFIAEALDAGFSGLKGHRSVGGCRASMYNAMPLEGAKKLAEFMVRFKQANA